MPKTGRNLILVFVGGAAGTGVRYLLTTVFPAAGALPVTIAINVSGAFLLGLLTSLLANCASKPTTDVLSLVLGTGFLGGYTTYGMLAVDTDGLLLIDKVNASLVYGLASVLLGVIAVAAGSGVAHLSTRTRISGGSR